MKKTLLAIVMTLTINASLFGITIPGYNALIALYNSTDGPNWTDNTNWALGDPCANNWYGVTCSGSNVIQLNLHNNQLSGTIPSGIGNLTNLTDLSLSVNQLSGTIPSEIGNLTNLVNLYLHNNQLSGTIPSEIGNLTNLVKLLLDSNQLSGTIPSEIGNPTNLTHLFLNNNQLSGTIPSEIGNLTNLIYLFLSSNQLSGTIPSNFLNITASSDFRYNYLSNTDAAIESWLDTYHNDDGSGGSQTFHSTQSVLPSDNAALIALYQSTNGNYWANRTNWGVGDPCTDNWQGVTCSGGDVVRLSLHNNNLQGNLPLAVTALSLSGGLDLGLNYLGNNEDNQDSEIADWLDNFYSGAGTQAFLSSQRIVAPTGLNFTNKTNTSVTLNWQDNSDNETGFKIFRDGILIHTTASDVNFYEVTGLTANTAYTFEVKATD